MKKEVPKYGRWTYVAFIVLNLSLFGPLLWIAYRTKDHLDPNHWVLLVFGGLLVIRVVGARLEDRLIEERDITELVLEEDD
ncbi:hypothetical protein ACFQGT_00020 [Natrialbaceae archaeon GCM10025810]